MGLSGRSSFACFLTAILLLVSNMQCEAQLSASFYDNSCPNALSTLRTAFRRAVSRERRMAASLIRLHFHDCFVHGCVASVLLNATSSFTGEKNAHGNANSTRGFEVVEDAKSQVEKICPGVVSCADVLAIAARDASVAEIDELVISGTAGWWPVVDGEAWKKRLHLLFYIYGSKKSI